jgi:hypothetical protein
MSTKIQQIKRFRLKVETQQLKQLFNKTLKIPLPFQSHKKFKSKRGGNN